MRRWKSKKSTPDDQLVRESSESDGSDQFNANKTIQSSALHVKTVSADPVQNRKIARCSGGSDITSRDDLPDGSCFSRIVQIGKHQAKKTFSVTESSVRKCSYVGSFSVAGNDHASRAEFVRAQLEQMRGTKRKKPVLLVISLSGIKTCSPDGMSVYMAHALRRISYATCDPQHCQFSVLAREPKGHFSLQYCHSFLTDTPQEAEELSTLVGSAFRMAYAQQLQRQQPSSFHDLISRQLEQQQQQQQQRQPWHTSDTAESTDNKATAISGAGNSLMTGSPLLGKEATANDVISSSRQWAKKLVGKTRHNDPLISSVLELNTTSNPDMDIVATNNGTFHDSAHPSSSGSSSPTFLGRNSNFSLALQVTTSVTNGDATSGDLWSPSSSEDNNSPTELNTWKQMKEKPPLLKTVDVGEKSDGKVMSHNRPLSGGYVNEASNWEGKNSQEINPLSPKKNSFQLCRTGQLPTAPATDEESLLELSSDFSSKRSSQSSCDQSAPSLSDSVVSGDDKSETVGCRGKRISHSSSNSSTPPPPPPERYDSLHAQMSEEKELKGAPWFQAGIPREIALEVLAQEPVGSFMVRESTSKPGCYALSLRVPRDFHPSGIAHYLIMRTNRGYKIKGFTKEFSTLTALITHHSVMPELLPCPLCLSRYNPTFRKLDSSQDMVDIDEDPDYNLLADFRKMMADLDA